RTFPALLVDDERVVDLSGVYATANDALADIDRLEPNGPSIPLAEVDVRAPYVPTQIMQSGANYRQHVIDLAVHRQIGLQPAMCSEELRGEATQMMDARIASGEPYVFLGAASALCGPYDDVVLPAQGDHDWELELAAVIGRAGRHVPVDEAL